MDSRATSNELLSHFERPQTAICPDFEWIDEVADSHATLAFTNGAPQLPWDFPDGEPQVAARGAWVYGTAWVLQWAAAIGVILIAANMLVHFCSVLAAEHALQSAARAGAVEATLPRATHESIVATVRRRLLAYPRVCEQLQIDILHNGRPLGKYLDLRETDQITVAVSAPVSTVPLGSLTCTGPWRSESKLRAHATERLPGRNLRLTKSRYP